MFIRLELTEDEVITLPLLVDDLGDLSFPLRRTATNGFFKPDDFSEVFFIGEMPNVCPIFSQVLFIR